MCRKGNSYIFIHIFKCGGTSVHNTLKELDGRSDIYMGGHLDAEAVYNGFKDQNNIEEFNNKFKFSIVRNPYDWLGSTYHYIRRSKGHEFNGKMINSSIDEFIDWFIDEAMQFERTEFQNKYLTQKQFLTKNREIDNKLLVDYFSKLEELDTNWKYILDQSGLYYKSLPRKNTNPKKLKSYKPQYGKRAIDRIQETFKEDFNFFEYEL